MSYAVSLPHTPCKLTAKHFCADPNELSQPQIVHTTLTVSPLAMTSARGTCNYTGVQLVSYPGRFLSFKKKEKRVWVRDYSTMVTTYFNPQS